MKKGFLTLLVIIAALALSAAGFASTEGELLIWADDTRAPIMEQLGAAFTADYGIPVKVQELGFGDIRDQLGVAAPAGEGPDIIVGAHDWLGQLVSDGLIEPIDLGDKKDDFVAVTIEAFTWGDTLYAVPNAFEAIGLIYNRELIETPPATWEELLEIARRMTDREAGRYGFLMQMSDPYHTFPLFSATGGYVFGQNPDGTLNPLDIGLNNAGSVRGLSLFDQMLEEGLIPAGTDYNTMTGLFYEGRAAMILTGPWALGGAEQAGIDFGFARLPTLEGGQSRPFVGAQGFFISAFSKNKILAEAFLTEFVATTDSMLAMYRINPRPPAYAPALAIVSEDPIVKGVGESAAVGIPMPAIPEMGSVWTAWADAIDLVASQQLEPQEALDQAVAQIKALIEGSR